MNKEVINDIENPKDNDSISRAIAKTRIYLKYVNRPDICKAMFKILDGVPSVQPSHKGHWIQLDYQRGKFECSECHTQGYVDTCMYEPKWKYCPNCGASMADMRGDTDADSN